MAKCLFHIPAAIRFLGFIASLLSLIILIFSLHVINWLFTHLLPSARVRTRIFHMGKWLQMVFSRFQLKLIGCQVSIFLEGQEPKDLAKQSSSDRKLVIVNHISWIDIPVIAAYYPVSFVTKAEVMQWPLMGQVTKLLRHIPVERGCLASRTAAVLKIRDRLREEAICVFPEGTTMNQTSPREEHWQYGAFWGAENVPLTVEVVSLAYENQSQVAWTDDCTFLPHLWEALKRKSVTCSLVSQKVTIQNTQTKERAVLASRKILFLMQEQCLVAQKTVNHTILMRKESYESTTRAPEESTPQCAS